MAGLVPFAMSACRPSSGLEGAWRASIQFSAGALAPAKDLQFLYVFNSGGTLVESSNYDEAPPVPPAYGVWRSLGNRRFEAKYVFFTTKEPAKFEDLQTGGGWNPAGHGVLVETIDLAPDGKSYQSTIRFDAFDRAGQPTTGGGPGTGRGTRIEFATPSNPAAR
jgi:hypothetical protein